MQYRKEIDGLRFIAVVPVIFFHAGIEYFRGGFVGVDIFFVISGFLITTILISDIEEKRFSIIKFYERRARRILPALFFVMFTTTVASWFFLFPSDMKDFGQSLSAVTLFSSNFLFWRQSGYFDTAAEYRPLLHTWSLAVEEQFYIFFPLLLVFLSPINKKKIITTLAIFSCISLFAAQWAAFAKPTAAFFLLPTRAWELLLGAIVAVLRTAQEKEKSNRYRYELAQVLGLVMILLSIVDYDNETPFPGLYALLPTVGTALIIYFGNEESKVSRMLGNRLFVAIGLISYSAYLWHQPVFALARHYGLSDSEHAKFIGLALISFALAGVTWRYIEAPFRNRKTFNQRTILIFSISGSAAFLCVGALLTLANGYVGQITQEQKDFLKKFDNEIPQWDYFTRNSIPEALHFQCDFYDIAKYRAGNSTKAPSANIDSECYTPNNPAAPSVFLWGDSHAQHLRPGLDLAAAEHFNILQVASSGCAPKIGARENRDDYCEYSNWYALEKIKELKPELVVIAQNAGHRVAEIKSITEALVRLGVQHVVLVGPSPHWTPSLPSTAARLLPHVPARTWSHVDKAVLMQNTNLSKQLSTVPRLTYVSLTDYFCNEIGCTVFLGSDAAAGLTSWDYGHLTPLASRAFGEEVLKPTIKKLFNKNLRARKPE